MFVPPLLTMPGNRKITPKKEVTEETVRQNSEWTLSEKKALITAIQTYGFGNISKIAEVVKTRSGSDIELFMTQWKNKLKSRLPYIFPEAQKAGEEGKHNMRSRKRKWSELQDSDTSFPLGCWIHASKNLIQPRFRPNDYSDIFENIFRSAATHESHIEPNTSSEPNFKSIYTHFASLLSGSMSPPPLSTTGSMLVVYLMEQLSDFVRRGDWPEETAYIKGVHLPTEFLSLENDSEVQDVGPVPLPAGPTSKKVLISSQLNSSLNLHKKVQENLNPMCIPMELLKKGQKKLEKHLTNM